LLCSNGHNNPDDARFCGTCGVNTFTAGTQSGVVSGRAPSGRTNGLSVASMVLGIIGWFPFIGLVFSIVAIILGAVARRQAVERGEKGVGMALAGIILGASWIALWIIVFAIGSVHTGT
jgi:hypothetical protein